MKIFVLSQPKQVKLLLFFVLFFNTLLAYAQSAKEPIASVLNYSSVLSNYQGFNEQAIASWPQSNNTVESIGGWRAYAQEQNLPNTATQEGIPPENIELHKKHEKKP